jgi:hypothetical protein
MSAAHQIVPLGGNPAPASPSAHWFASITTDPPPPSDEEIEAFVAWCAAHPSTGVGVGAQAARWALFSFDWLLAQVRARPASGGAPPATSTRPDL